MSDQVDTFLAITGSSDTQTAQNFLEMSGNNLEAAISLFFEHGPSFGASNSNNDNNTPIDVSDDDEDARLAERLQNEENQHNIPDEPRAPIESRQERLVGDVFPGTFGGIGGSFNSLLNHGSREADIFGRTAGGIFAQRDDDIDVEEDNDSDGRIVELDSDDNDEDDGLNESQRRLQRLFRPPFDLIQKVDLDSAKVRARSSNKWILVNIQDTSDFQCQILNRDFWSNHTVKTLVRENFFFLQYHKDSRSGEQYSQFYHFDEYPHIAILDPITGERLKYWSKVPVVSEWVNEIEEFLKKFSLNPTSINPVVEHKPKIDIHKLTEEQQLQYAINQSMGNSGLEADPIEIKDDDDDDELVDDGDIQEINPEDLNPKELTEEEIIKQIEPVSHEEPENSSSVTRIQIRTGDGKRVVRKFDVEDPVRKVFEFTKFNFADDIGENGLFQLTSQRENLISKLEETINEAGLKNASVLLEIVG
ncbi:hypothetical protein WICMUC_001910 [Wickerhamomyces mucosus]|uniref:UBX domain-containing protein n=1 Tax=Wickerhamomyces mucosus TaxID=1378264 RepID=A0A9P8PT43_9ASCO|nr:hypothetical protein WICMUC_001910 [Wickerhamomyces mucosus]